MSAFDAGALAVLDALYPEQAGKLRHGLRKHPLLQLGALAELAARMRPVDVEYNSADLPIGIDPAATPGNGLSVQETIASIERNGSWMVLKFIEQDAVYRTFLQEILSELRPAIIPRTGPMLKPEGFVFISSPDAVTPFHFDPEHNILLQVRGDKIMTVFPAGDEEVAGGALHEAFHRGAHRNLPWRDRFASKGVAFSLSPGDALYVPVKAPHWVKNGSEVSVSLSVTWRSEWSYREEYAHGFNRLLRKAGLRPAMPRRYPHQNHVKSAAYRLITRAQHILGRLGR